MTVTRLSVLFVMITLAGALLLIFSSAPALAATETPTPSPSPSATSTPVPPTPRPNCNVYYLGMDTPRHDTWLTIPSGPSRIGRMLNYCDGGLDGYCSISWTDNTPGSLCSGLSCFYGDNQQFNIGSGGGLIQLRYGDANLVEICPTGSGGWTGTNTPVPTSTGPTPTGTITPPTPTPTKTDQFWLDSLGRLEIDHPTVTPVSGNYVVKASYPVQLADKLVGVIWRGDGDMLLTQESLNIEGYINLWGGTGDWRGYYCAASDNAVNGYTYSQICDIFAADAIHLDRTHFPKAMGSLIDIGWGCYGLRAVKGKCIVEEMYLIYYGDKQPDPDPCRSFIIDGHFSAESVADSAWSKMDPALAYGRIDDPVTSVRTGWPGYCDLYGNSVQIPDAYHSTNPVSANNWLVWFLNAYGGYQVLGGDGFFFGGPYSNIKQNIYWPGGDLYYRYQYRGSVYTPRLLDFNQSIDYQIYLIGADGNPAAYVLADEQYFPDSYFFGGYWPRLWNVVRGVLDDVSEGWYTLSFRIDPENAAKGDFMAFDEVEISNCPVDTDCNPVIGEPLTPTPVPTLVNPNEIQNCDFEWNDYNNIPPSYNGFPATNWPGQFWETYLGSVDENMESPAGLPYLDEPGGPVETNYLVIPPPAGALAGDGDLANSVSQAIYWDGGEMYIYGWARGYYRIALRLIANNASTWNGETYSEVIWSARGNSIAWEEVGWHIPWKQPGRYRLELINDNTFGQAANWDGISLSGSAWTRCGLTVPTVTPTVTGTPGPTATGTVTPATPTLTRTPTVTGTRTPSAWTPTPGPTQTAKNTNTPVPQPTQPPRQDVGCTTGCASPGWLDGIGAWTDYLGCVVQTYFAWCPDNTAAIVGMADDFNNREPFGTIKDFSVAGEQVYELVATYDWQSPGLPGVQDTPDVAMLLSPQPSLWTGQPIDLSAKTGSRYSTVCNARLAATVGEKLAAPMCFIFNVLHGLALMPWLQLFINICFAFGLVFWFRKHYTRMYQ